MQAGCRKNTTGSNPKHRDIGLITKTFGPNAPVKVTRNGNGERQPLILLLYSTLLPQRFTTIPKGTGTPHFVFLYEYALLAIQRINPVPQNKTYK